MRNRLLVGALAWHGRVRPMRYPNLVALSVLVCVFVSAPASALKFVYVVRHAQKNPAPNWSAVDALRPLSPKGARCAGRLGQVLDRRGITAVYSSEYARTLATGAAFSTTRDDVTLVGDNVTVKPTPEFVEELRERHAEDQAILVVGHSNTVADVVLAFRPDTRQCLEKLQLINPENGTRGVPETQYGDIWRLDLDLEECRGVHRQALGRAGEHMTARPLKRCRRTAKLYIGWDDTHESGSSRLSGPSARRHAWSGAAES